MQINMISMNKIYQYNRIYILKTIIQVTVNYKGKKNNYRKFVINCKKVLMKIMIFGLNILQENSNF